METPASRATSSMRAPKRRHGPRRSRGTQAEHPHLVAHEGHPRSSSSGIERSVGSCRQPEDPKDRRTRTPTPTSTFRPHHRTPSAHLRRPGHRAADTPSSNSTPELPAALAVGLAPVRLDDRALGSDPGPTGGVLSFAPGPVPAGVLAQAGARNRTIARADPSLHPDPKRLRISFACQGVFPALTKKEKRELRWGWG